MCPSGAKIGNVHAVFWGEYLCADVWLPQKMFLLDLSLTITDHRSSREWHDDWKCFSPWFLKSLPKVDGLMQHIHSWCFSRKGWLRKLSPTLSFKLSKKNSLTVTSGHKRHKRRCYWDRYDKWGQKHSAKPKGISKWNTSNPWIWQVHHRLWISIWNVKMSVNTAKLTDSSGAP